MSESEFTERYAPSVLAPLGDDEGSRAVEIALERLVRSGGRRERLIAYSPQLQIEKPQERGGAPRRFVRVPIRDRDEKQLRELTVDMDAQQVVAERRLDGGYPPPTAEELETARRIAEADERVREAIGDVDVAVRVFSPAHEGDRSRRVGLEYFRLDAATAHDRSETQIPVGVLTVDVDLDEEVLLSIVSTTSS